MELTTMSKKDEDLTVVELYEKIRTLEEIVKQKEVQYDPSEDNYNFVYVRTETYPEYSNYRISKKTWTGNILDYDFRDDVFIENKKVGDIVDGEGCCDGCCAESNVIDPEENDILDGDDDE